MCKFTKVVSSIFIIAVVLLGISQLAERNYLLGQEILALCCNNGLCDNGNSARCSYQSSIKSEELLGCNEDDNNQTCQSCIDLQSQNKVCGYRNSDAYCCLVDPGQHGGVCPDNSKYCVDLDFYISGPSSIPEGQDGTWVPYETCPTTGPYTYNWYRRYICDESDSNTDGLPCDWDLIGTQRTLIWGCSFDFILRLDITDGRSHLYSAQKLVHVTHGATKMASDQFAASALAAEISTLSVQNYPNPFNAGTTITFSLPQAGHVSLVVYNTHGQRVATLISEQELAAGHHKIVWNGKNEHAEEIASGIYLCRLVAGLEHKLIRLVMLK